MNAKYTRDEVQRIAAAASAGNNDPTRHKSFISYHVADVNEVAVFLEAFGSEIIPRSVGVAEDDEPIDSSNERYIKDKIRNDYLRDSTVTIVLLGACTWSRKFVDWEISSSLRNDSENRRNGLLVYPLPSLNNSAILPARVSANLVDGDPAASYASYLAYPQGKRSFRANVDAAFNARSTKADLVDNRLPLMQRNKSC